MSPENNLTAPELLQMIRCKCGTDKPCSRKICNCSKAQLSCSKFCKCLGSTCYNTWTTLDENSDCGDDDGVEEADDDGSANEQRRVYLRDTVRFIDL